MNTERLVKALCEYNLNPTEIADILWLALRQPVSDQPATSETKESLDAPVARSDNLNSKDFPADASKDDQRSFKPGDRSFNIAQPSGVLPLTALPIAVPDAGFLPETLPLVRALKPLLKRVASATVNSVNEAATVDRIAETDIWLPVMQADQEPWFEVALVIDSSAGMTLWQRLIADIQRLLRCYGSFRDLRIWELVYAEGKIGLQSGSDRSIRSPKELLTADGRRITIVFSDCTADYWWNGKMQPVLASWGNAMPTVVWQVLPDWMWKRTALGAGEYVSIRNRIPGANNQELQPTFLALRPSKRRQKQGADRPALSVCLPVISTDIDSIASWSRMLAGDRRQATPGFVFPASGWDKFSDRPITESAEQRLEQFRLRATPLARRLAALLSAAPVITLPVMRLIRAAMLSESSPLPVAEVFLSGLLQRVPNQSAIADAELVQYDFLAEMRDQLLGVLPVVETIEVIEAVSRHVADRLNCTLVDFRALLLSPDLQAEADLYGLRSFARVTAQILRKLGGDYAVLADRFARPSESVEQNLIGFPLQDISYESATITAILDRFDFETAQIERRGKKWKIDRYAATAWGYTESLITKSTAEVGLDMMAIPSGSFRMGASIDELDSQDDERPQHDVVLQDFYFGRYSITQAQWRVVAGYDLIKQKLNPDPSIFKGDNLPVESITWQDAQEFCQRLSAKTGKKYRLPSEAEWEYACRAETVTPFYFGETISSELANYDGSATYDKGPSGEDRNKTTAVGIFPANSWGLYDMHGNIWEWCEDDWHGSYEGAPNDGSAWVKTNQENTSKLARSGSWIYNPSDCRSASRLNDNGTYGNVGFRVVCEPPRILLNA